MVLKLIVVWNGVRLGKVFLMNKDFEEFCFNVLFGDLVGLELVLEFEDFVEIMFLFVWFFGSVDF